MAQKKRTLSVDISSPKPDLSECATLTYRPVLHSLRTDSETVWPVLITQTLQNDFVGKGYAGKLHIGQKESARLLGECCGHIAGLVHKSCS